MNDYGFEILRDQTANNYQIPQGIYKIASITQEIFLQLQLEKILHILLILQLRKEKNVQTN